MEILCDLLHNEGMTRNLSFRLASLMVIVSVLLPMIVGNYGIILIVAGLALIAALVFIIIGFRLPEEPKNQNQNQTPYQAQ